MAKKTKLDGYLSTKAQIIDPAAEVVFVKDEDGNEAWFLRLPGRPDQFIGTVFNGARQAINHKLQVERHKDPEQESLMATFAGEVEADQVNTRLTLIKHALNLSLPHDATSLMAIGIYFAGMCKRAGFKDATLRRLISSMLDLVEDEKPPPVH